MSILVPVFIVADEIILNVSWEAVSLSIYLGRVVGGESVVKPTYHFLDAIDVEVVGDGGVVWDLMDATVDDIRKNRTC